MRRPDFIARQAASPSGFLGRLVARILTLESAAESRVALELLDLQPTDHVLEIGLGHGKWNTLEYGKTGQASEGPPRSPKGVFSMDMAELEGRLTRMEDIEAIKQLKAYYCDICDDDHNPDRITTIFAEDGIWEGDGFGKAEGHAAIRELFQGFQKRISFSQHQVMNPIIEINGDRAKGIWYFFGPFTFFKNNQAKWLAARYEDDYVKVNGEWKIQHLRARGRMNTEYETSWANRIKSEGRKGETKP